MLPGTPAQRGENLVKSTFFFDNYYLHPDPEDDFDPLFYDHDILPTPDMHWDMSRMWAAHALNLIIAPRGSAKSSHERKDRILKLVTAPAYKFTYGTSTSANADESGQAVKDQCYENERINRDFAPVYGLTNLKPAKGNKPTGVQHFYLANGSQSRQISTGSRFRGGRPRRFRLDDPEYDATASTSHSILRENLERFIFNVVMPAVSRRGCGVDWTATFVSQRHYAWHAMRTELNPDTGLYEAAEPRFNFWNRLIIRAAYEEEDGSLHSCWPYMWPATIAQKRELGLDEETKSLEELRAFLGEPVFQAEMMANPGSAEGTFFDFDTEPQGRHGYWFEEIDPQLASDPFTSEAIICWRRGEETIRQPLSEFFATTRRFTCVDTAYTEKTHSDRRACVLMAVNSYNELFVLDVWSDRKKDSVLIEETMTRGSLWRVPSVHVETVKEAVKTYHAFASAVSTGLTHELNIRHIPAIRKINPGPTSKVSKISALDVRFEHDLIKLPLFARYSRPALNRLVEEISSFNPEADDGGLQHDDELDCVSMSLFVIKGRIRDFIAGDESKNNECDIIEHLEAGNLNAPGTDLPLLHSLPLSSIPIDTLLNAIEANQGLNNATRKSPI